MAKKRPPLSTVKRGETLRASLINEMNRRTRDAGGAGGGNLDSMSVPGLGQVSRKRPPAVPPDVFQGSIQVGNGARIYIMFGIDETWFKQEPTITVVKLDGTILSITKATLGTNNLVTVTAAGWIFYDVTIGAATATAVPTFTSTWPPTITAGHVPILVGSVTWDSGTSKIIKWYQALYHNPTVYEISDGLIKVTANDTTPGYLYGKVSVALGDLSAASAVDADSPLGYAEKNDGADEDLFFGFDIQNLTEVSSLSGTDDLIVSTGTANTSRRISFANLQGGASKVKVTSNDTTANFLHEKISVRSDGGVGFVLGDITGDGNSPICFAESNDAGDEDLFLGFRLSGLTAASTLSDTDAFLIGNSPLAINNSQSVTWAVMKTRIAADLDIYKVKISADDTTPKYLEDAMGQLVGAPTSTPLVVTVSPGGPANEVYNIDFDIDALTLISTLSGTDQFILSETTANTSRAITATNIVDQLLKLVGGYNGGADQVLTNQSGTLSWENMGTFACP